jgi:predicted transcriptional regulator
VINRNGRLDASDFQTASNGWAGDVYGNTMQFESDRLLYQRMEEIPGTHGQFVQTDDFYSTAMLGSIGEYYRAEKAIQEALQPKGLLTEGLRQNLEMLESNRLSVEAILKELSTATTGADSAALFQKANTEMQNAQSIQVMLEHYGELLNQEKLEKVARAILNVNKLSENTELEAKRKTVLKVYLESIGSGYHHLTAQQMLEIEPIAEDCPLNGGSAVFMARALYRLNIARVFLDDKLCLPVAQNVDREITPKTNQIEIVPNPAQDHVTIEGIRASESEPAFVRLLTLNGQELKQVATKSTALQFSTADIPQGMYLCSVQAFDGKSTTLKLIVQH